MSLRRRATQREVAALAGVSQATVSQVLNGTPGSVRVPEATRQRVLGAMQEVGYVPNVAARRLVGGQSRLLGVFTYEPVFPSSTRDFYAPFLQGIEEAAAELDYDLLLHTRPAPAPGLRTVYRDGGSRLHLADGTIMLGALDTTRRQELTQLLAGGHPAVFIGRREVPGQALPYVTADYRSATSRALRALIRTGRTRPLYVGGVARNESAQDRELGFHDALRETDLAGEVARPEVLTQELVQMWIRAGVNAVLFEHERLCHQWTDLAGALGLAWPADYAFAVLGDPLFSHDLPEGWAHYSIPRREMGREATRLLVEVLSGGPGETVTLPCLWSPALSLG